MSAQATLCIWLPGGYRHVLGAGHGGLEVEDEKGKTFYVTWLPANAGGSIAQKRMVSLQGMEPHKKVGFKKIRNPADGKIIDNDQARGSGNEVTLEMDKAAHNFMNPNFHANGVIGPPHYMIDIPVAQLPGREPGRKLFGVSIRGIKRYWKNLLALPPDHPERVYGMLSTTRNCNAVVAEALMAGGLWMYATPPDNVVFQDARTLLRWVETARDRIEAMNEEHDVIAQQLAISGRLLGRQQQTIPTLKEWQTESDKGISFWSSRIEQVAMLDRLIPLYHQARARNDRPMEFHYLMGMQVQIYLHLTRKPKSDRRQAVLNLARRVYAVLGQFLEHEEELPTHYDDLRHLRANSEPTPLEAYLSVKR
jgi:hypothetical protein